ncbi:cell division protein ZapB [candidate division TA06 bacterium]|uniref:Cell division protein ZapB n=1 Tax=candidate division TA06 bacterium TaxID=2250710 RepID=A0A933IBX1_UNCT6|nr:cell division protein ZapB [candidate division TA06 bacterium]
MSGDPLAILEERINRAVDKMAELKNQKEKLEKDNQDLKAKIDLLTGKLKAIENEKKQQTNLEDENQKLQQSQEEAKKRLSEIIDKLEKLKD